MFGKVDVLQCLTSLFGDLGTCYKLYNSLSIWTCHSANNNLIERNGLRVRQNRDKLSTHVPKDILLV